MPVQAGIHDFPTAMTGLPAGGSLFPPVGITASDIRCLSGVCLDYGHWLPKLANFQNALFIGLRAPSPNLIFRAKIGQQDIDIKKYYPAS